MGFIDYFVTYSLYLFVVSLHEFFIIYYKSLDIEHLVCAGIYFRQVWSSGLLVAEIPGRFTLNNWLSLYPQINTKECVGFVTTHLRQWAGKTIFRDPRLLWRIWTTHFLLLTWPPTHHPWFLKGPGWRFQMPQAVSVATRRVRRTFSLHEDNDVQSLALQNCLHTVTFIYTFIHVYICMCMYSYEHGFTYVAIYSL